MIGEILRRAQEYLSQKLEALVIYDPQPVQQAEPHVRLTFTGSGDQGSLSTINFQLSLVAAGDGPDVFLEELVKLSLRIHDLFSPNNGKGIQDVFNSSGKQPLRIFFKPLANTSNGQFIENERTDSERNQFHYTYVEPHVITISFPRDMR